MFLLLIIGLIVEAIALLAALAIYVPLFFLCKIISQYFARILKISAQPYIVRWGTPFAVAVALASIPAIYINHGSQAERKLLILEDKNFDRNLQGVRKLGLLLDPAVLPQERYHSGPPASNNCNVQLCQNLLIDRAVDEVLIGGGLHFGQGIDPSEKMTRFRLSQQAECIALAERLRHTIRIENGKFVGTKVVNGVVSDPGKLVDTLDNCIISENGMASEADAIVLGVSIPNTPELYAQLGDREMYNVIGGRLLLYQNVGGSFRELYRETRIGGSDIYVPPYISVKKWGFFGGYHFNFARKNWKEPKPFDIETNLLQWGLSKRDHGVLVDDNTEIPRYHINEDDLVVSEDMQSVSLNGEIAFFVHPENDRDKVENKFKGDMEKRGLIEKIKRCGYNFSIESKTKEEGTSYGSSCLLDNGEPVDICDDETGGHFRMVPDPPYLFSRQKLIKFIISNCWSK